MKLQIWLLQMNTYALEKQIHAVTPLNIYYLHINVSVISCVFTGNCTALTYTKCLKSRVYHSVHNGRNMFCNNKLRKCSQTQIRCETGCQFTDQMICSEKCHKLQTNKSFTNNQSSRELLFDFAKLTII